MMECHVHPLIDYAQISTIIRRQKEFVLQRIKELSTNDHRYSGAALKELIGEPLIRVNHMGVEEKFKIDPMQIPGVQESGWSWKEHEELIKTKKVSFVLECQNLLELLKKHPSSWPFRDPVSLEDVPDYGLIVKEPIDLKTIEKKLGAS
jgi:histone acetyltransferase